MLHCIKAFIEFIDRSPVLSPLCSSISTVSDAARRAAAHRSPMWYWREVLRGEGGGGCPKRVCWSSHFITPDPGHPGAELRCRARHLDALVDTRFFDTVAFGVEVILLFFRLKTRRVHLRGCSPWEQRAQRSGTGRARRMPQPPLGSWVRRWPRCRREAASSTARYSRGFLIPVLFGPACAEARRQTPESDVMSYLLF